MATRMDAKMPYRTQRAIRAGKQDIDTQVNFKNFLNNIPTPPKKQNAKFVKKNTTNLKLMLAQALINLPFSLFSVKPMENLLKTLSLNYCTDSSDNLYQAS